MTTDITELAKSLKAAAEKATPGPWRRSSVRFNGITDIANPMEQGSKPHVANASEKRDAEFIALANPSNILALVEALEKAQQRISELESPTFTFEVTAEPFTCPRCGTTTTHPEGWHYCHKREAE
ncbi:TPA: ead/Ea22-like family protein [Raoultella ornithinolytica]|nr:ead/Ea22-like family protein [Raoultella ornithinolytica]